MRVLVIKTSSMGDVLHTLPALTDAGKALPSIQFDWVVEEGFAEIPKWHPLVDQVIPVALRRWRKNFFSRQTWTEWQHCRELLKKQKYDFIIDAQGLLKSAWLNWSVKGIRCGLNWGSARESLASLFYQRKFAVQNDAHAIQRLRQLFSQILNYPFSEKEIEYGIKCHDVDPAHSSIIFIHGTTWPTKLWPEDCWIKLGKMLNQKGFTIKLPWGTQAEFERAQRIAANCENAEVLSRMKLSDIAKLLKGARACVAVDTGLGHLAAALSVPTVSLYGPTDPNLIGTKGQSQIHLSARSSSLDNLAPEEVMNGMGAVWGQA